MPPDRDIEFVIELVSGTTPIYKRPHRMAAKQLAELNDQIKELLEKGYIRPSSPHGEPLWFSSRRRMVLNRCAYNTVLWMRLPSRTSTCYLGLMIYLVNFVVRVCSLKSIFDRDRIDWRYENVTFWRLPSLRGMVRTSIHWCLLDWLMLRPTIWIWWIRPLWSIWTSSS
jgi:hypothetical protein